MSPPLRLLCIGSSGQAARALAIRGKAHGVEVVLAGRPGTDLLHPDTVTARIAELRPDVVVNAAAYTAVDRAESDVEAAFAANAEGAGAVAAAARRHGLPVVHLSTDYVFGGALGRPRREDDPIAPLCVYGRSKAEGEQAVAAANPDHAILRIAWVYAPFGANFLMTMLRLAAERTRVRVVHDQVGAPTCALDVADGVLRVAANLAGDASAGLRGVFHMAPEGACSWAEFAEAIFAESRARGGPAAAVERIGTRDYPTPAVRPADSRLDSGKIAREHRVALPHWRERVGPAVASRLAEEHGGHGR